MHEDWLLELVQQEPEEMQRPLLDQRQQKVGLGSVWRFSDRHGISFKESVRAAEQDRPDVAAARTAWANKQPKLDPDRLIFIDETGTWQTAGRQARRVEDQAALAQTTNPAPASFADPLRSNKIRIFGLKLLEGAIGHD